MFYLEDRPLYWRGTLDSLSILFTEKTPHPAPSTANGPKGLQSSNKVGRPQSRHLFLKKATPVDADTSSMEGGTQGLVITFRKP